MLDKTEVIHVWLVQLGPGGPELHDTSASYTGLYYTRSTKGKSETEAK